MKATELRIGNYVLNQTGELKGTPVGYPYQIKAGDFIWADLFLPIPLTEQWLKDFGFEINDYDEWELLNPWWNMYYKDGVIYDYGEMRRLVDIKYVHQLQNLYFALTEKELTK